MTDWNKLDDERRAAADREWESYDFTPWEPEDTSGWSHETGAGESEWSRPVYFVNPHDPEANTIEGHFVVRFASLSAEVVDVYGRINGEDIGLRVTDAPRP